MTFPFRAGYGGWRSGPRVAMLFLAALTAASLASGLTGCGGSGDDASPPITAHNPDLPAVTEDPLFGEPTDAPTASAVAPCELVSQDEAEALAQTPLDDPRPVRETCTWTGPVTGPTAQVEVFVGDGAKKFLDIERELGHELRPLPGIGDEAYIYVEGNTAFVHKGGVWVSIRLVLLNDPQENRERLAALLREVAGRI